MTRGLSELMVSGELGLSLETKWNLNPLCNVSMWCERPSKSSDKFQRRSRAIM
jgi:hypothetical protein